VSGSRNGSTLLVAVSIALVIITLLCFAQVRNHDFIGFDDDEYVTENYQVRSGVTLKGIAWAFTTNRAANWHPLTWLSHMVDCQLYGLNAWGTM